MCDTFERCQNLSLSACTNHEAKRAWHQNFSVSQRHPLATGKFALDRDATGSQKTCVGQFSKFIL
jgi:hypothetical protein